MTTNTNIIGIWDGEQLDPVEFLNQTIRVLTEVKEIGLGLDMEKFVNSKEIFKGDYQEFVKEVRDPSCGTACCGIGWLGSDIYFNSLGLYLGITGSSIALRPFINSESDNETNLFDCTEEFTGIDHNLFWSLFESDAESRIGLLNEYVSETPSRGSLPRHYHCDDDSIDDLIHAIEWVRDTLIVKQ